MIKTVIIDDEAPARNILKQIIADKFRDVELIGEADSVATGVALIESTKPELVLLDINLSDGLGFNILEQIEEINFQVIFVTAYDTYAIKAFQFNALDYILKPIKIDQLLTALTKAKKIVGDTFITKAELKVFIDNYTKGEEDRKIAIREASKISYIIIKDIVRLKGEGSYTTFHLKDQTKIVSSKTLKVYEELLPESLFYRVHQSDMVNMDYVKAYNKEEGGYAILTDDTRIDVARRRKEAFLEALNQRNT